MPTGTQEVSSFTFPGTPNVWKFHHNNNTITGLSEGLDINLVIKFGTLLEISYFVIII